MTTLKKYASIIFLGFIGMSINAQEFGYGFKAGLNFSTFLGPEEQDLSGNALDAQSYNTGFLVGATFNFGILDNYGIRGEFQYNQRGTNYKYEGLGYYVFNQTSSEPVYATGTKRTVLSINNSYLEIPVMGYAKITESIEFTAGIHLGLLIACTADGETTFEGNSDISNQAIPLKIVSLDYNYRTDPIGFLEDTEFENFMIDSKPIQLPTVQGAYADYTEKDGTYFAPFDIGLNAGFNFYLNEGLYFGLRGQYGLIDVTKSFYDRSLFQLNTDRSYINLDHKDHNLNFQVSMGFSL